MMFSSRFTEIIEIRLTYLTIQNTLMRPSKDEGLTLALPPHLRPRTQFLLRGR